MRPLRPAMLQNVFIVATGVGECVGECVGEDGELGIVEVAAW